MNQRAMIARGFVALAGVVLVALALLNPSVFGEYREVNDAQDTTAPLKAASVLEQRMMVAGEIDQFSVRVSSVKQAKGLTLEVSLYKGNETIVQKTFPLEKTRPKARLIVDLPSVQGAGEYLLRVKALGEGDVTFCGGEETTAIMDGQPWPMGLYLRMNCIQKEYSAPAVFSGALLLLLALTPGGGKEARRDDQKA